VMFLSTLDSLEATQARYYREYRFADLPEDLALIEEQKLT